MAVSIKLIHECPRCHEGITSEARPKFCPNCEHEFGDVTKLSYQAPLTLTEQLRRYQTATEYADFLLNLEPEKTADMLNDALNIIETLSGKKADVSDIRILVEIAQRIGEVATKYDEFLRAGGKHAYSILNPPKTETANENTETPRDGGQSSAS